MALAASYAMVGVAIALLAVYGADVAAAKSSPDGGGGGEGFLPFDHMARGLGLGLPSMVLPIAAFFVSRKEPSRPLGALLAAAGILIIVGGAVVLAMPPPDASAAGPEEPARNAAASAAPLLVVGSLIVALGAIKVRRS